MSSLLYLNWFDCFPFSNSYSGIVNVFPSLGALVWLGVLLNDSSHTQDSLDVFFPFVQSSPEVHANAAELLCAITRNTPSPLTTKLSSPRFVGPWLIFPFGVDLCCGISFQQIVTLIHYAPQIPLLAVLLPGYLVMPLKTRTQSLPLSIRCLSASLCWIQEDQFHHLWRILSGTSRFMSLPCMSILTLSMQCFLNLVSFLILKVCTVLNLNTCLTVEEFNFKL